MRKDHHHPRKVLLRLYAATEAAYEQLQRAEEVERQAVALQAVAMVQEAAARRRHAGASLRPCAQSGRTAG